MNNYVQQRCRPAGSMARRAAAALAVLLGCAAAAAEPVDIQTPSGVLRLDAPAGYSALDADERQAKFGRHGRRPLAAWGNPSRSSTVAVTWSRMAQKPLTSEQLPALKASLESTLPKLTPGLQMLDSSIVTIAGRRWVRMESTAPAVDTGIRNLMYLTDLGGHMVGVNYNATDAAYPGQEAGFRASAGTLQAEE